MHVEFTCFLKKIDELKSNITYSRDKLKQADVQLVIGLGSLMNIFEFLKHMLTLILLFCPEPLMLFSSLRIMNTWPTTSGMCCKVG